MKQNHSYIAPDVEIDGSIFSEGPVRFDGRCEGSIEVNEGLTIGEPSVIRGKVSGGNIVVNGTVVGEVVSSEKVAILAQGNIKGDIATPSGGVSVSKGGNLDGRFFIDEVPQSGDQQINNEGATTATPNDAPIQKVITQEPNGSDDTKLKAE